MKKQLMIVALAGSAAGVFAGDWTGFRGPLGNGLSDEVGLPVKLSAEVAEAADAVAPADNRWLRKAIHSLSFPLRGSGAVFHEGLQYCRRPAVSVSI